MNALFGSEHVRHATVISYFRRFTDLHGALDFVVVCGDLEVNAETTPTGERIWVNYDHEWYDTYENFNPCDAARKPGAVYTFGKNAAYTLYERLIYLCPVTLESPKGLLLTPYISEDLSGQSIVDFMLAPVIILHELLRGPITRRKFLFRSRHHIIYMTQFPV